MIVYKRWEFLSYKVVKNYMQKLKEIDAVIAFIENNLSDELNPESVAKGHFVSLSGLYRDFYSYTGHSVKEYIRKRR